ncbi:hypothetical protein L596_000454 [Steinernema carpocapsae]|uniref:Uncharacterized protein n=1 Tax=Steinernema carpocapsae TaxID=34508 RepID=A0A4U8UKI4_STECR|nr:hypothetical protein L596_000454 [Steinernema carpocapsae]
MPDPLGLVSASPFQNRRYFAPSSAASPRRVSEGGNDDPGSSWTLRASVCKVAEAVEVEAGRYVRGGAASTSSNGAAKPEVLKSPTSPQVRKYSKEICIFSGFRYTFQKSNVTCGFARKPQFEDRDLFTCNLFTLGFFRI